MADLAETPDIPSSSFAAVVNRFVDTLDLPEPVSACNFDFDSWCTSSPASAYSRIDSAFEAER